jgi:hypothetical protein
MCGERVNFKKDKDERERERERERETENVRERRRKPVHRIVFCCTRDSKFSIST